MDLQAPTPSSPDREGPTSVGHMGVVDLVASEMVQKEGEQGA